MFPLPVKLWYWALDYWYVVRWYARGTLLRTDPDGYRPDTHPAAVLIPGIYEPWQIMQPVIGHLFNMGYQVHIIHDLGYNSGNVAKMAKLAYRHIVANKLTDVTIVAHSKGGLVGKYMMASCDSDNRIKKMVAVCTPFSGSHYAMLSPVPSIRALSPRNKALRTLQENLEANQRITSIYSAFDPHIPGGCRLDHADNIELPLAGHFRIMGHPLFYEALRNTLNNG